MSLFTHILQLIRFDKPAGTILLLLPCYWGAYASAAKVSWQVLLWCAVGALAMRSAGCIINDMADRKVDAQVERTRTRPLASGAITMRHASITLVFLLIIAGISGAMLGWQVLGLGVAWLPLVAVYPFMKRITFFPQVFLGLTFGAGALFGSMAVAERLPPAAWWLYAAGFFWVLGYDTIYACQDRKDDARIGVKSTALFFGERVRLAVGGCYTLMCMCVFFALHTPYAPLQLICFVGMTICMMLQLFFLPSERYMAIFKSNVITGLLVLATIISSSPLHAADNTASVRSVARSGTLQNVPYQGSLTLTDASNPAPISASTLKVTHQHKLHAFVVDSALSDYQHLHPELSEDGTSYRFAFTPNTNNSYSLWTEFTRHGSPVAEQRKEVLPRVANAEALPAQLKVNGEIRSGDIIAEWVHEESQLLQAGKDSIVAVRLRDAAGKPVNNLQPIMGAYAHMVGFNASNTTMLHAHPLEKVNEGKPSPDTLRFHIAPKVAGMFRIFLQVKRDGQEHYLAFDRMIAAPESKPAASHQDDAHHHAH
jgi:4-hydroxybenzoate polyprenyltransferase